MLSDFGWVEQCICAKLEPDSSKNNEILKINVLQKFTLHALYTGISYVPSLCWILLHNTPNLAVLSPSLTADVCTFP